ncbi:OsmC family protein [Halopseudomonas phragmitis]|uniref:Peroxiredoxin n=2 Tax=Pseudomonadaceae TaxID=135621 RepID=A0A1V0B1X7_9GAMM|nr:MULTISPECIES: OsmC family protein [Pseudomonadaceae]AQZ93947.1 peroxiredoxin [Halopseudomonas phragmitis]RHW20531.1 OsmC family peroxiredoxin [Pseudomonas jilinensis]
MSDDFVRVTLEQQQNFRFLARYDGDTPELVVDEPAPLGGSAGPSPSQLLITAVTNCLSDSLYFALSKFRQPADGLRAEGIAELGRNAENRLRIVGARVTLHLGYPQAAYDKLERILGQFEQFCTVSQSIAACLPISLQVLDSDGEVVKG